MAYLAGLFEGEGNGLAAVCQEPAKARATNHDFGKVFQMKAPQSLHDALDRLIEAMTNGNAAEGQIILSAPGDTDEADREIATIAVTVGPRAWVTKPVSKEALI